MGDTLTIRTAGPDDLAGVDALLGRSYPALLKEAYPPSLLVMAVPLISKANPRLLASGSYFVVEDATGVLVGAGGWTRTAPGRHDDGDGQVAHVRHVVTDHRRVRSGIGQALMTRIFDTAREAGITRLDCFATLMAVPFYAACGFREEAPVSLRLDQGIDFPAVLMRRKLS
ncbi:MAG: GNAT family N-acetyltransferase [Silicimonas sp.]|nr:GNAT family N-acetyltransferase [Silicimonas sp.]